MICIHRILAEDNTEMLEIVLGMYYPYIIDNIRPFALLGLEDGHLLHPN
jgi:hypothetical protein